MNFSPEKTPEEEAALLRSIMIGGIIEKTAAVISREGISKELQDIIGKGFDFGEGKNIGQILRVGLENASPSELKTIENRLEEHLKEKSE